MFLDEVLEMIYHPKEKETKQLTIFDIIDEQRNTNRTAE